MRVADKLEISRNLSMVIPADRAVLVEAAAGIPELARLVEEHLDDYLRLFPEDHWREVHSGGLIAIQSSKWLTTASNIQRMLETTEKLKHLEAFPGFSTLLSGFRDAAKVDATLFEVSAATWCATRTASLGLEFSPEITVKDRQKHPDFLWHTVYGDLYCECKGARIDLSSDSRRLARLTDYVKHAYAQHGPWSSLVRLDITPEPPIKNRVERRIWAAVEQASQRQSKTVVSDAIVVGEVSAVVRPRNVKAPRAGSGMRKMSVQVNSQYAVKLTDENAEFTVAIDTQRERVRTVAELLRTAREQLPASAPGAAFIDIIGAKAAIPKVEELLALPVYANTPCVSLWEARDPIAFIWRPGQPFDHRLTDPFPPIEGA